jgi:hypothetical protein
MRRIRPSSDKEGIIAASGEALELDATLVQEWHAVVAAIQMNRYQCDH